MFCFLSIMLKFRGFLFPVLVSFVFIFSLFSSGFSQIVVTTTSDNGPGSLRQAIIDANNDAGPDSITFNISQSDPAFKPATGTSSTA